MRRLFLLVTGCVLLCQAQILPPLIGHLRDRGGRIVPIYGVAGTFTLGEVVVAGVTQAAFGSGGGLFRTDQGWFLLRDGRRERLQFEVANLLITPEETWAQSDSAECFRLSHAPDGGAAACPAGALSLSDFTSRLELPEAVTSFERMGSEWFVLRGECSRRPVSDATPSGSCTVCLGSAERATAAIRSATRHD
jgi:hypothetical protein